jgi:pectate lyase
MITPNGIINIADGQYTGTNNTNITINKNITIQGQSETGTIINGTNTNWIFQVQPGTNVVINNLTITNVYLHKQVYHRKSTQNHINHTK